MQKSKKKILLMQAYSNLKLIQLSTFGFFFLS